MRSSVTVLAGSEQALDRQPAQDGDLHALPETGLGLGVEADLIVTFASHPLKAVSHKFYAIRVAGVTSPNMPDPNTGNNTATDTDTL
jgi:hypothetical protein